MWILALFFPLIIFDCVPIILSVDRWKTRSPKGLLPLSIQGKMPHKPLFILIVRIYLVPIVPCRQFLALIGAVPAGYLIQQCHYPSVTVVYLHLYIREEVPVARKPFVVFIIPIRGKK